MTFEYYSPSFRQVLLLEDKLTKTEGGIFIPSTTFITEDNPKEYKVVKVGKDCTEVKVGDTAKLMKGIFPDCFDLFTDGKRQTYFQVMEQQIIGYERIPVPSTMADFELEQPELLPEPEFKAEVVTGMTEEDYNYKPLHGITG